MIFSELVELIQRFLHEDPSSSDEGSFSEDEIKAAINQANRAIVNLVPDKNDLHELITSETYTAHPCTLPSGFDSPKSVTVNGYDCHILPPDSIGALQNDLIAGSIHFPTAYIQGSILYISPEPSSVTSIVLKYVKKPDLLESDSDEPEIKEKLHEFIADLAIVKLKYKIHESEEADRLFAQLQSKIDRFYGLSGGGR